MGRSWDLSHDPFDRPLGCNGKWGNSGSEAHKRRGEEPCEKCLASSAHYAREYRRGGIQKRKLAPCGTTAAAERHRTHREPLDFACRLVMAAKEQKRREARKAKMGKVPTRGPNSPYSVGKRTILAQTCLTCGEFADGDSFPVINTGKKNEARRKKCHKCVNTSKKRDRELRGIGLPTPKPPEILQTSRYHLWSSEDDQLMRDLIAAGTPYEEIAVTLGRSLKSVYQRRVNLGIAKVRKSHRVAKPWKIEA